MTAIATRLARANEAWALQVIERNADAMLVVSRDGLIRLVTSAAEAFMGCKAEQLIGQPFGFPVVPRTARISVAISSMGLWVTLMTAQRGCL